MDRITVDDVDPTSLPDAATRREVGRALGATDVALNHYTLASDEALAETMHGHGDQEEVFYVLDGTLTFEVRPLGAETDREVRLDAGEAIRFAPGDLQCGRNPDDRPATVLALGAPPDSEDLRFPFDRIPPVPDACSTCGHDRDVRLADGQFSCPACGADLGAVSD